MHTSADAIPVVLYAAPDTSCFKSFHDALVQLAAGGGSRPVVYVHRPYLATQQCQVRAVQCAHRVLTAGDGAGCAWAW